MYALWEIFLTTTDVKGIRWQESNQYVKASISLSVEWDNYI